MNWRKPSPWAYQWWILILVGLGCLVLLLTSCSMPEPTPWDGIGIVTNLEYDDPDDWTTTSPGMCISRDKNGACTARLPDQVTHHHDDAHWWVQVTTTDGTEHRVEVDQARYDYCCLGARFQDARCVG